jgi:hypothetical protein
MDNESAVAAAREEKEKKAAAVLSLLKTLEDISYNHFRLKKQEMYKTELIKDLISRYPSYC